MEKECSLNLLTDIFLKNVEQHFRDEKLSYIIHSLVRKLDW